MGIIVALLDITDHVKHVELGVRASGLKRASQDAFKAVIHKGIHDSRLSLGMVQIGKLIAVFALLQKYGTSLTGDAKDVSLYSFLSEGAEVRGTAPGGMVDVDVFVVGKHTD